MYDEQRNVEEITSPGIEKRVVKEGKVSIDSVAAELAKYDIYQSYLDQNSTSCANIVVDELSYFREGVTNPNTTTHGGVCQQRNCSDQERQDSLSL